MDMRKNWSARELDLDLPAAPVETIKPTLGELDIDDPRRKKTKWKPDEEQRDALPADRNRLGWWKAPYGTLPGYTVGFAYAKSKNDAGFYVSFTIIWRGRAWSSTPWRRNCHGWKTKRAAMDYCIDRLRDSQRPKKERRYVIAAPE